MEGVEPLLWCCLSNDASHALTGSRAGLVKFWELHYATEELCLRGHGDFITCCAMLEDPRPSIARDGSPAPINRFISTSVDGSLRLWNLDSTWLLDDFEAHPQPINSSAISQDGRVLGTVTAREGSLRLFHMASGQLIREIDVHNTSVNGLVLTADTTCAAVSQPGGGWDLKGQSHARRLLFTCYEGTGVLVGSIETLTASMQVWTSFRN